MASVYEIIQGINQAAANAYDGSHEQELAAAVLFAGMLRFASHPEPL